MEAGSPIDELTRATRSGPRGGHKSTALWSTVVTVLGLWVLCPHPVVAGVVVRTATEALCPVTNTNTNLKAVASVGHLIGGLACCHEVAPGGIAPWERDYLLELARAPWSNRSACVCTGNVEDPVKVDIVSVLVVDYPIPVPVEQVRAKLRGFSSRVVVFLGDEQCLVDPARTAAIVEGFGYTVLFRQYVCGGRGRPLPSGAVMQPIPLGYGTEMMNVDDKCTTTTGSGSRVVASFHLSAANDTRVLRWAFLGTERANRRDALRLFRSWEPHRAGQGSKTAVAFAYSNADFVLSPRGNENLDCFRSYEASAFGAIPIVVGDEDELHKTFTGLGPGGVGRPPWLFVRSWEEALTICREMSPQEVRRRRQKVLEWWISWVDHLQALVAGASTVM